MPFQKGVSGNKAGRPKQTQEQKEEKEQFKALLKTSTVSALESIIAIANDRYNKDRFNACKFIIDKAYGSNTSFLLDGSEEQQPLIIEVVSRKDDIDDESAWEEEWNNADNNEENEEE